MKELITIQQELNAPKGQYNKFGKFKYRSCEDILAAVKPLLKKTMSTVTISDDIMVIGERVFVKANATLMNSAGESVTTTGFAEIEKDNAKGGMDASQRTGSASSYARKYALNGLLAIDDTKDSDATNTYGQAPAAPASSSAASQGGGGTSANPTLPGVPVAGVLAPGEVSGVVVPGAPGAGDLLAKALDAVAHTSSIIGLKAVYNHYKSLQKDPRFINALSARKKAIA